MNIGTFIGRVGGDAELKYTQSGKAVCSFSLAIDQGKDGNGQKKNALWIKATMWEKRAESLAQYITKGKMVAVSGPVGTEAWISSQNGEAQSKIVVTVREFTFCGGGERNTTEAAQPAPADDFSQPSGPPLTDEDIPF